MKQTFLTLSLVLFLVNTIHAGHPENNDAGFTPLIVDGKLSGLITEGNWKIQEDGSIYLEPRKGEEGWKRYNHYLTTAEKYGDFVFDFEYKHAEGGNSGFYFRVSDSADPVESGYEVQIMDSTGVADDEMGHHDLGGIIKTKGASKNMSKPNNEWNRMTVTMKGNHLTVVLNGETVQDFDLSKEKPEGKELDAEGYLSIQDHGLPFWVRNLQVKGL